MLSIIHSYGLNGLSCLKWTFKVGISDYTMRGLLYSPLFILQRRFMGEQNVELKLYRVLPRHVGENMYTV